MPFSGCTVAAGWYAAVASDRGDQARTGREGLAIRRRPMGEYGFSLALDGPTQP